MEDDLKKNIATIKSENNKNFENRRWPTIFWERKTTSIYLKMEDKLNLIMQLKTIKSKNNLVKCN
jgi:hypothetical protein